MWRRVSMFWRRHTSIVSSSSSMKRRACIRRVKFLHCTHKCISLSLKPKSCISLNLLYPHSDSVVSKFACFALLAWLHGQCTTANKHSQVAAFVPNLDLIKQSWKPIAKKKKYKYLKIRKNKIRVCQKINSLSLVYGFSVFMQQSTFLVHFSSLEVNSQVVLSFELTRKNKQSYYPYSHLEHLIAVTQSSELISSTLVNACVCTRCATAWFPKAFQK